MKEKRYFCDYWFGEPKSFAFPCLIIVLSLIIITPISSNIKYNTLLSKHRDALNSYSESTYQHLDEIANNVIQEGIGINLLELPDDVVKYEIATENNEIIFKYYLDNNKDIEFAVSASMTVKLSDNFEIISKEPNFSSKENYIGNIKFAMISFSIWIGLLNSSVFIFLFIICCTIIAIVSSANKNKNLS